MEFDIDPELAYHPVVLRILLVLSCVMTFSQDVGELVNRLVDDDPGVRDAAEAQLLAGNQQTLEELSKILETGSVQNTAQIAKLKSVIETLQANLDLAKAIPPLKKASFKFSSESLQNALTAIAREFGLSIDAIPKDGIVDGEVSGNVFEVLDSTFAKTKYRYYLGPGNQVSVFAAELKPPCVDTKFGRVYARNINKISAADLAESELFVVAQFEQVYPQTLESVFASIIDINECRNKDETLKEYVFDARAANRQRPRLIEELARTSPGRFKIFRVPSDCAELSYSCTLTVMLKGSKQLVELTKSDNESKGFDVAGYRLRFGKMFGRVSVEIEQSGGDKNTDLMKDLIDTGGVVAVLKSGDSEKLRLAASYGSFSRTSGTKRSSGIYYNVEIEDSKYDEIKSVKVPVQNIRSIKEQFTIKIPLR